MTYIRKADCVFLQFLDATLRQQRQLHISVRDPCIEQSDSGTDARGLMRQGRGVNSVVLSVPAGVAIAISIGTAVTVPVRAAVAVPVRTAIAVAIGTAVAVSIPIGTSV